MACDCIPDGKSLDSKMQKKLFSGEEKNTIRMKILDTFFMARAKDASFDATCKKRRIGCLLVTEEITVSGANGTPEGIDECKICPRVNAPSGTQLERCKALHAEVKVLAMCARKGLSTKGGVVYLYGAMPCKNCLLALIEAQVKKIVCNSNTYYDSLSKEIFEKWKKTGGELIWMEFA